MKTKRLSILVNVRVMLLVISAGVSAAHNEKCAAIKDDDAKRLACYDELAVEDEKRTASESRKHETALSLKNPFALTPYRINYVLPYTHNSSPTEAPFQDFFEPGGSIDESEAKFQISVQFEPLGEVVWGLTPYITYTQLAFWQIYSSDISRPFRETNYEPEIGVRFNPHWKVLGLESSSVRVGLNHQSNGRGGALSRSWNRLYATFSFEHESFVTVLRPWMRFKEDVADDDNPDIEDFLGNFEWYNFYKDGRMSYGLMLRNNFDSGDDNRGAYQLDLTYSLPDVENIKLYLQVFNGYGESLIDYNHRTNRIGFGLVLVDWL